MDPTLIAALIPAIVTFAAGWLVSRKIVSKKTLNELMTYGQWAVYAAEEAYKAIPQSGSLKFEHAVSALQKRTGVSTQEAETVILSCVNALRRGGYLSTEAPKSRKLYVTPNDADAS